MDASSLECGDLVGGTTLTSSDNSTSVSHAAAWRGSLSSDEADSRQVAVVVGAEPLGGLFLGLATDLTDHDDTFGLGIVNELSKNINEVSSVEGVTTDSDDGGLAQALGGRLVDSLVGEGARATDNTDFTLGVDVAWHNSDLALTWLDDTWAVWSDQASFVLGLHDRFYLDHIQSGDTFGDAHDKVHLSLDSLKNGVGGEGGRHVDHGGLGVSGGLRLSDGAEDGETEMLTACLALVNTTNNLGAVGKSLFSMECTLESENQKES